VAHLGRPLRAWRIFLGWKRSWLSREALVFGLWFAVATLALFASWPEAASGLREWLGVPGKWSPHVTLVIRTGSSLLALVGLGCSAMIYADTPRVAWRWSLTVPRFFASAAVAGSATALALGVRLEVSASALIAATLIKLAAEVRAVGPIEADDDAPITPALRTARVLAGPLRRVLGVRLIVAALANVLAPIAIATGVLPGGVASGVLVLAITGEFVDRCLFFRAVDPSKMPGMPSDAAPRRVS
jgi:DMSO reductase anchor subunit